MKAIAPLSVVSVLSILITATACSSQGEAETPADEGALHSGNSGESATQLDRALVGAWVEKEVGKVALFHSATLRADGTYTARGGCSESAGNAAARCHAITVSNGRWSTSDGAISLNDSNGTTKKFFYKVSGTTAKVSESAGGDSATFGRLADNVAGPDDACGIQANGATCGEGYECRGNCPEGAMCFVNLFRCVPKVQFLKKNAPCSNAGDAPKCAEGLSCKDNCPPNALCIVQILTCQEN